MEKLPRANSKAQVLTLPPRMGSYVWVHKGDTWYLKGGFLFEAKANNDITIGLSTLPDPPNLDPSYQHVAYEIVLGGWLNIKSALRKFGTEVACVTKQHHSEAVITSTVEFCKYWVVLDDGLIIVGKGVGRDVREILRWKDSSPVRIRSFGLTTWNTPIQFRSILFEPLSSFTSEVNLDLLATTTNSSNNNKDVSHNSTKERVTIHSSVSPPSSSSSSLSNLKNGWKEYYTSALDSETFADIEIVFNKGKDCINAHRALLFSVPYFRKLLLQDQTKLQQEARLSAPQSIELNVIHDNAVIIPRSVMKMLLQFAYTGELSYNNSFNVTSAIIDCDSKPVTLRELAQLLSFNRLLDYLNYFHFPNSDDDSINNKSTHSEGSHLNCITTTAHMITAMPSPPSSLHSRECRPKEHNFKLILKNKWFGDVTFVLKDMKTVVAHRVILSSWSDFFKALFTNGMRESSQQEIRLEDISYSAFNLLLKFMYTGGKDVVASLHKIRKAVCDIDEETATELIVELLLLSDQFGIPQLKGHCVRALYNNLTIENACQLVCFADDMELAQFREHCLSFIESHFNSVSSTDLFLELPFHILLEIVLSDDLIASSEMEIFNALLLWIQHNTSNSNATTTDPRSESGDPSTLPEDKMEQLLGCVRYPLMDKESLSKLESDCSYIKRSPFLLSLVRSYISDDRAQALPPSIAPSAYHSLDLTEDFRKKTRTVSCLKELRFVDTGDENGLFYYFGTNFGKASWVNPHKANRITIRLSGPTSRYCAPEFIVSRTYKTTCHTTGHPPWFTVDLGKYCLIATHYTLCHDGSDNFLRNWCLQGANKEGEWVELMVHKEDDTIYRAGQFASFKLSHNKQTMTPYRLFRVLMIGPSSTSQNNILSCSGFELYGYLI